MNIIIPKQWGMGQEGNEQAITDALVKAHAESQTRNGIFQYLEVGIYTGGTMRAVHEVCKQMGPSLVIGFDAHDHGVSKWCPPYRRGSQGMAVIFGTRENAVHTLHGEFLNVVFVDACHCVQCAMDDFTAFESFVPPGGRVIFHDASPLCQDKIQGNWHGQHYIQVREAFKRLYLLPGYDSGPPRPHWQLETDMVDVPFGVAVFKRTS